VSPYGGLEARDVETPGTRARAGRGSAFLRSGEFRLRSGGTSDFVVDCEALTDVDLATAARLLARLADARGGLRAVTGVPRGGLRLAAALGPYVRAGGRWHAVADDVYTTGASLRAARDAAGGGWVLGLVLVARAEPPPWVLPLLRLEPELTETEGFRARGPGRPPASGR